MRATCGHREGRRAYVVMTMWCVPIALTLLIFHAQRQWFTEGNYGLGFALGLAATVLYFAFLYFALRPS